MKFLDYVVSNTEAKIRRAHTVQGLLFESVFSEFTFGCQPTGEGDRKDRKENYEDKKYVVTFTASSSRICFLNHCNPFNVFRQALYLTQD